MKYILAIIIGLILLGILVKLVEVILKVIKILFLFFKNHWRYFIYPYLFFGVLLYYLNGNFAQTMIIFLILLIPFPIYDLVQFLRFKFWKSKKIRPIVEGHYFPLLDEVSNQFYELYHEYGYDKEKLYVYSDMPLGRANTFLTYYNKTIFEEEALFFAPVRSFIEEELKEYGLLITNKAVYYSEQVKSENEINNFQLEIPYEKLWRLKLNKNSVDMYISSTKKIRLKRNAIINPIIYVYLVDLIEKGILRSFSKQNGLFSEIEEDNSNYDRQDFHNSSNNIPTNASIPNHLTNHNETFNELKNNMDGERGGGYGAEYGNITADKINGHEVENLATQLDKNGHQIKHGADKIVDGVYTQTKYYKTANESIGAAFRHNEAIYLTDDGNMMQIEVPRDQYMESLELMQKRIDKGHVPLAKPGDNPGKYVKRGHYTYENAFNITLAGSIEGLKVDIQTGVINSIQGASISILVSFAQAIWSNQDPKEAAKTSIALGLKSLGKGTVIFTVTNQLSRGKIINPFVYKLKFGDGVIKGNSYFNNPIVKVADNLVAKINKSNLAQSGFGKTTKLDKMNRHKLIGGAVTFAVVFGPDIYKTLVGKISVKQLTKNSIIGGSSIVGSAVGQAVIPIPIVGAVIGGTVAGLIAKNTTDKYIEDDAKEMYRILKEEFLDVVMLHSLTKEEMDEIVSEIFLNKKLPSILQDMYAFYEPREFARKHFVSNALSNTMKKRTLVTQKIVNIGFKELVESEAA